MNSESSKRSHVIRHLLFWCGIWLLYVFFFSYNSTNSTYAFAFASLLLPVTSIVTYTMVYFLIPKYLNNKNYLRFGLYVFGTLLFTTFYILMMLILSVAYFDKLQFDDLPPMGRNYVYLTVLVYLIVALVSFISTWRKNENILARNSEIQQQLLTSKFKVKEQELAYLKNQIHPHFLFNSLNTIYGFALKQSIETPDIVLKLSGLLDYILYQTDKPEVSLEDEITHLEEYIALESIRFNDTLKVKFHKDIPEQEITVPPMLLLPFVENAFKHGSAINGFIEVKMSLSVSDKQLHFSVQNTYKPGNQSNGLGLNNIKERLAILYPGNHELRIDLQPNYYEVTLTINHLNRNIHG